MDTGQTCRGKIIDHIYTNVKQRLHEIKVDSLAGSRHCLVQVSLRNKVKFQGPRQAKVRDKKKYTRENYL